MSNNSTCESGELRIFIPYAGETTTQLLRFTAGSCEKTINDPQNSTNYNFHYDEASSYAVLGVDIEACGLADDLYDTPYLTRNGQYFMATANVTHNVPANNRTPTKLSYS